MRLSKSDIGFLKSLSHRKVREEHRKFLVEGWRTLNDALNSDFPIDYVAMTASGRNDPEHQSVLRAIERRKIALKDLSETELRQVSDTVHSQGVIALVGQAKGAVQELGVSDRALIVVADRIADPGNLGSLVRTCDWFGVDALILSEGCVDLYNEKVIRSTAGSIFHTKVVDRVNVEETLSSLKGLGFRIVGTAAEASTSYTKMTYPGKTAIVMGSEASGLSPRIREQCDAIVSIGRHGRAESLNVTVACGIILSFIRSV